MSSFQDRQKSLFNHLKDAEEHYSFCKTNKATDSPDYSVIDRQTYRKIKKEMKQFRGKESIFKRNEANIRECLRAKRIPDHVSNPQKWVYYSLADVTPDQMSDSTNTATALALMHKMEEDETAKLETEHGSNANDEFIFKKPTFQPSSVIKKPPPENEKVSFKNSKVIMPEYVVGVSKKKEKNNSVKIRQKGNNEKKLNLKLNHLYDENENEDE